MSRNASRVGLIGMLLALALPMSSSAAKPSYPCHWVQGRLATYNGGWPNYRIWKSGTSRLLGVRCFERVCVKSNEQDAPEGLQKLGIGFDNYLWGDFYVCPQEQERAGWMRPVGLIKWRNIFVEKL